MKEDTTDFLDEFDTDTGDVAAPAVAPTSEPQTESGQPRNPDGTFATTKAEKDAAELAQQGVKPEAQPAPGAEPPSADDGSPNVPRAALEAERKKRQALEAELAKLKPAAGTAPQSQPPAKSPEFGPPQIDFQEDPQSYVQAQIHSMRMEQSKFFAAQQSSPEMVAEAWQAFDQACNADPAVSAYSETLINHHHPMGEVVKWYRQQQDLRMLTEAGGLDALREKWLAEAQTANGGQSVSAPARPAMAPKPTPPPSLANGGAGAHADPGIPTEEEDFNGLFEGARKPRKR